ncbi:MAG: LamG domain-containing protein [Bacteroidales bacterium]|nr:LamG domain-containing protein [Bacteroidales bacterium]
MKRISLIAAFTSLILLGFSCKPSYPDRPSGNATTDDPDDPEQPVEYQRPEVKTCAENLVLYISFDNDNLIEKGEGVTFAETAGDAFIAGGFIEKGWTNQSGVNSNTAYTKFDVAAGSLFTKLESITFTAWIKASEEYPKGGIVSLNGARSGNNHHDFPAFIIYYDNYGADKETGEPWQQVNGRLLFHDAGGNEQNFWLDASDPAFARYGDWCQFAATYDYTVGVGNLYLNGLPVRELTFGQYIPFNNLVTEFADAFYVGGWSSFIEGDSFQTWQNYWAGSIDEIRLFDKAFSEDEILALYKEELAINLEME